MLRVMGLHQAKISITKVLMEMLVVDTRISMDNLSIKIVAIIKLDRTIMEVDKIIRIVVEGIKKASTITAVMVSQIMGAVVLNLHQTKLRTMVSRTRGTTTVVKLVVTSGKAMVEDNNMEDQLGQVSETGHASPAKHLFSQKMNYFCINKPLMAKSIVVQVLVTILVLAMVEVIKLKTFKRQEYMGAVATLPIITIKVIT